MNHESFSSDDENSPWENFSMRELQMTSEDRICDYFLKEIERTGQTEKIAHFIDEKLRIEPKEYASTEGFCQDNPNYTTNTWENLTPPQRAAIKSYTWTGPDGFSGINCVARGFWDYNKLGRHTDEKEKEIREKINQIATAIPCASAPEVDFVTFRGDNLDGFKDYGIHSLQELARMEGQFYIDSGFHSTALLREKSFASNETSTLWVSKSNIEIIIHIPAGSRDCIALLTEGLSHSPGLTEVLLNMMSLCYVSRVDVSRQWATVEMLLIPRALYNSPPQ